MSIAVGVAMGTATKNPATSAKRYTHREDRRVTEGKLIKESKRICAPANTEKAHDFESMVYTNSFLLKLEDPNSTEL